MSGQISAPARRVRHEVLDGVAVMAVSLGCSVLVAVLFLVATAAVGN
jgi:hypothetical protein